MMTDFGPGSADRMEAELDAWHLEGERRFAASGSDDEIEATVRAFTEAGATTVLLQSRSDAPELRAFVHSVARIGRRLLD